MIPQSELWEWNESKGSEILKRNKRSIVVSLLAAQKIFLDAFILILDGFINFLCFQSQLRSVKTQKNLKRAAHQALKDAAHVRLRKFLMEIKTGVSVRNNSYTPIY